MSLKEHTVKSYDKDLQSIAGTLEHELELVLESIAIVESSLLNPTEGVVQKIIDHDYKINHLDHLIEKKVTAVLAMRQPMAFDLRYIITSLKVSSLLERVGDQAKSIVKKISYLENNIIDENTKNSLLKMLEVARVMVSDAVSSFNNHDLDLATKVLEKDDEIDTIYHDLFDLIDHDKFDRLEVKTLINILFIAKSFERLADYATNIAEITKYIVTGEIIEN